eukprot:TRINITY_DN2873_c0_g1_i1.p1 TRINITY_DN2873_c0_g1~~TRINITY_DN2873_c0_g1_i1.p1  ORF type:complete len:147 (-),score=20.82 TRINITY_DN2873_c0_g1_i1:23-424(-)
MLRCCLARLRGLHTESITFCVDDSGATALKCIGTRQRRWVNVGHWMPVAIKAIRRQGDAPLRVKRKQTARAVILTLKAAQRRPSGITVEFGRNTACVINDKGTCVGGKINGPVSLEVKKRGYGKLADIAKGIY